jgi:hypothetical protein
MNKLNISLKEVRDLAINYLNDNPYDDMYHIGKTFDIKNIDYVLFRNNEEWFTKYKNKKIITYYDRYYEHKKYCKLLNIIT